MNNLIMTVITIVLLAVLAMAGLYFFGDKINENSLRAEATSVMNQGGQIAGAIKMYQATHSGAMPTEMEDLQDEGLLSSIPAGAWEFDDDQLVLTDIDENVCAKINAMQGLVIAEETGEGEGGEGEDTSISACSSLTGGANMACCTPDG